MSRKNVRWICDLRAWLEDVLPSQGLFYCTVTVYLERASNVAPPPSVEVAETEEMLTFRVACSVFRLEGLSRQVSVR